MAQRADVSQQTPPFMFLVLVGFRRPLERLGARQRQEARCREDDRRRERETRRKKKPINIKKRLLQKSEGNFSEHKVLGELFGGFLGGFFGPFFIGKNRRKKFHLKSTAKFTPELGSFAAKIHSARIWP